MVHHATAATPLTRRADVATPYHLWVHNHPGDKPIEEPQAFRYPGVALGQARRLSIHPLEKLRPFYVAVYHQDRVYPLAMYRNGLPMGPVEAEMALAYEFTRYEVPSIGKACSSCLKPLKPGPAWVDRDDCLICEDCGEHIRTCTNPRCAHE